MTRLRWLIEGACMLAMIALAVLASPLLMALYLYRMNEDARKVPRETSPR